jgi:hypothetical protein
MVDASSAALSIALAVIGYISTALHTLRAQQHTARVGRCGEQLKELYGPLLACVTASKSSYDAMLRQASHACGKDVMKPSEFSAVCRSSPGGPSARCYHMWVREVLLPLSEKAANLVVRRADLLEGSSIEPLLLQLVAHVSALKVLVRQWEQSSGNDNGSGEFDLLPNASAIPYPDDLQEWVERGYSQLKRRQAGLLGIGSDGTQGSPLMRLITSRL